MQNIDQLAAQVVELSLQQVLPNHNPAAPDPFREMVSGFLGVDLSRLPSPTTAEGFVLETLVRGLGRLGVPDDIGGVVSSFCSEEDGRVTAQRLEASGGIL